MKLKNLLLLLIVPFLITGCEFDLELYDPSKNGSLQFPSSSINGVDTNVINPSNYKGSIKYAENNQTKLSKEEVYQKVVTSTVYITGPIENAMILGSGVVFSEDDTYAYIFTNAHVVDELDTIDVTYSNYKKSSATIVGYNILEDVAVIKVNKNNNYTVATLQTSDNLIPGMDLLAIGTPASLDFSFSVTSGVLSKIDSPISSTFDESYGLLLLQVDVPLNNGNSGGPLFDLYGNLIGINSIKLLLDDNLNEIDDMNFSIPMERAVFMANSFFNNKPYIRGKIGISIIDLVDFTISEKASLNISLDYGLLVSESSNSAFKENDIITKINNVEFKTRTGFQKELYNYYNNEEITFTVYRNNEYITVTSTLK